MEKRSPERPGGAKSKKSKSPATRGSRSKEGRSSNFRSKKKLSSNIVSKESGERDLRLNAHPRKSGGKNKSEERQGGAKAKDGRGGHGANRITASDINKARDNSTKSVANDYGQADQMSRNTKKNLSKGPLSKGPLS